MFWLGLVIGLVIGVAVVVAVTIYALKRDVKMSWAEYCDCYDLMCTAGNNRKYELKLTTENGIEQTVTG